MDRHTDKQIGSYAEQKANRQTERQTNGEKGKHTYTQMDRRRDKRGRRLYLKES